jgi:threonine dehydrogenase-like Zn-dependent dehydrogenase
VLCGASAGVAPDAPDAAQHFTHLTGDGRFDVAFEATGSPAAFNPALRLLARGGRLVLLGSTRGLVEQFDPYTDIHLKGITVIGAHITTHPTHDTPYNRWTLTNNRRLALHLIGDESLALEPLISHRAPGEDGPAMFERLAASRESVFGVLLQWH